MLPWCAIGDFNDFLHQSEKRGDSRHPNYLINGFRRAVEDCGLMDLRFEGYPFTWERGRGQANWVEEKMDRALTCKDWIARFDNAIV